MFHNMTLLAQDHRGFALTGSLEVSFNPAYRRGSKLAIITYHLLTWLKL